MLPAAYSRNDHNQLLKMCSLYREHNLSPEMNFRVSSSLFEVNDTYSITNRM